MLYLAGIMLLVGISIAVIAAIRRWSRGGQIEDSSSGLTLGQARHMKAKGLLTEQEFDQVKRVIVESAMISEQNTAATVTERVPTESEPQL